jgi:hypothetical protein
VTSIPFVVVCRFRAPLSERFNFPDAATAKVKTYQNY